MKLDFSTLEGPAAVEPLRKRWGQAGTAGTPAAMRVAVAVAAGDGTGTGGDGGATFSKNNGAESVAVGIQPGPCPPMSPPCPHQAEGRKAKEIKVSLGSPLVPCDAGTNESGGSFDGEAFEERAAIMEFDGGLTRAEAEAAALALLFTAE